MTSGISAWGELAAGIAWAWVELEWLRLVVVHPKEDTLFYFRQGQLEPYSPPSYSPVKVRDIEALFEHEINNLPVLDLHRSGPRPQAQDLIS
ncbi:MAG: hypothetical protein HC842_08760 [Cytophagales bacterium]|nr:hypothetical protein [Cytophagales bacterium]